MRFRDDITSITPVPLPPAPAARPSSSPISAASALRSDAHADDARVIDGAAERIRNLFRDESMRCNFGIDPVDTIKLENTHRTRGFRAEVRAPFERAVEFEYSRAEGTMPRGALSRD